MVQLNPNWSATETADVLATVKAELLKIDAELFFLEELDDDDIKSCVKLDSKKEGFNRDTILEVRNDKGKVPSTSKLEVAENAFTNYNSLYEIEDIAVSIATKIKRNRIKQGDIAHRENLGFYASIKLAVGKIEGAAAIFKRLAVYFKSNSNGGNRNDPPTETKPKG